MLINEAQNIYMVGMKGFGMASLATVLVKMGKHVTGSDVDKHFPTDDLLDKLNITCLVGFSARNIPKECDLVVTTGAHGGLKNPEVVSARKKGIPVMTHAEALGSVMDMFKNRIAICGSHGKTTTSSMCSYTLYKMGVKMGYQVGVPTFSGLPGGDYTGNDYFVVESDEYVASPGIDNTPRFMYQHPNYALCMNIDLDHIDVYPDLDSMKKAYKDFFNILRNQNGTLVYCHDDENTCSVVRSIKRLKTISYGTSAGAQVSIDDKTIRFADGTHYTFDLKVPGKHNILNAAGVLILIRELGLDPIEALTHINTFTGPQLRFEVLYDTSKHTVINDYGHHPAEVKVTLEAARSQYPQRRLLVVFHPHTLSRTRHFKDAFLHELEKADKVYMLDIFASARDDNDASLTSEMIVDEAHTNGYYSIEYLPQSMGVDILLKEIHDGDVILFIGAGDKFYLYEKLIQRLQTSS